MEPYVTINLVTNKVTLSVGRPVAWTTIRSLDELPKKIRELIIRAIDRVDESTAEILKSWLD